MIKLPWPHKDLSPNARAHWRQKAKASKAAKEQAYWLTKEAKIQVTWDGPIHVHMEFCQPTRRRMDIDNMLASSKWALDGIALALGVDDSRFELRLKRADDVGGYVLVAICQK